MARGPGARHNDPCTPVWEPGSRTAYQFDGLSDGLCAVLPLAHFGLLHPPSCSAQFRAVQGCSLVWGAWLAEDGSQAVWRRLHTGLNAGDGAMGEARESTRLSFQWEGNAHQARVAIVRRE